MSTYSSPLKQCSIYNSPLKYIAGNPSPNDVQGAISSNQQREMPSDSFLTLDPVLQEDSDSYPFTLHDRDNASSLYGRDW